MVDDFKHRAAQKAAGAVRHTAAVALHAVGDWFERLTREMDVAAAHVNGDPVPGSGPSPAAETSEPNKGEPELRDA